MDKTELLKKYSALPKTTREVLASQEFIDAGTIIGKKYNMTDEQCSTLVNITIYHIVGLLDESGAKEKIKSELNIHEPVLTDIYNDINTNIVSSINNIHADSLKNIESNLKNVGVDFVVESYMPSDNAEQTPLDKNTEQRVLEVATKYDLTKDQTDKLINDISTYINDPNSGITAEDIASEIGVSNLVAEQIALDLESRVFTSTNKPSKSTAVEVPPQTLPTASFKNPIVSEVPNYTPRPVVITSNEPVQTPVSVPRFKAVPMDDNEIVGSNFIPNIAPKPSTGGLMESKINKVPDVSTPSKSVSAPKYTVDPYREPLA